MATYFYGEDTYGARQAIDEEVSSSKATLSWIDREDLENRSLAERLGQGTNSLFGKELLVIRDVSGMPKAVRDDVTQAVVTYKEGAVIVWDRGGVDKRSSLWKTLKKRSREFPLLEVGQLVSWVVSYAKELGATIDQQAASALITRVGRDRFMLSHEIEKLSLRYKTIGVSEVEGATLPAKPEVEIFALLDSLSAGKKGYALKKIEEMLSLGESELYILSMLAYQFRVLYLISAGITDSLHSFVVQKNQAVARRKGKQFWLDGLTRVMATDFAVKQGMAEPKTALTMLVLGLQV